MKTGRNMFTSLNTKIHIHDKQNTCWLFEIRQIIRKKTEQNPVLGINVNFWMLELSCENWKDLYLQSRLRKFM